MPAVLKFQRTQSALSGRPEDATVNSLYFMTAVVVDATLVALISSKIDALFNTVVGAGQAVRSFMAESTMGPAGNQNTYKVFNLDDTPPRVPIFTPVAQNLTPLNTTTALPSEVACCLSFRGPLASGVAMARRRGRIYVGPLNVNAMEPDPLTGQARPAAAFLTALTAGANRMHDDLVTAGVTWCVYSPTSRGGGAADLGCTTITEAWADNAFDTQRRRGQIASARVTLTL